RTGDRCAAARPVAQVEAPLGQPVDLPDPADCRGILTLRVDGLAEGLAARLLDVAFKGPEYVIEVATGGYRFVPGTAGQPHVLWAPGDPGWLAGPHRFRGAEQLAVRAVAVGLLAGLDTFAGIGTGGTLRYTFE